MLSQQLRNTKDGTNIDTAFFLLNRVSERNKILPLRLYSTLINVFTERCSRYQTSVNNRILWTLKRLDHSVVKQDQRIAQR
jgi:hypothetical protein